MVEQEVDFKAHQTSKSFEIVYHINYDKFIVRGFHITQNLSHNFFKSYPCLFSYVLNEQQAMKHKYFHCVREHLLN